MISKLHKLKLPLRKGVLRVAPVDIPLDDFVVVELARRHRNIFMPDFIPWLRVNINVFMMFDKAVNQLWDEGFRQFSARNIIEGKLKFNYLKSDLEFDFVISHSQSGDLSRLYALLHPERVDMFRYTRRDIDFKEYTRSLLSSSPQEFVEREEVPQQLIEVTEDDLKLINLAEDYDEIFRNPKFILWLKSSVYSIYLAVLFIDLTNQLWDGGKRYFSARTIAEKVKYDCTIAHLPSTGRMTKYSADLARLYALKYPRRARRIFNYDKENEFSEFINTKLCELEEQQKEQN